MNTTEFYLFYMGWTCIILLSFRTVSYETNLFFSLASESLLHALSKCLWFLFINHTSFHSLLFPIIILTLLVFCYFYFNILSLLLLEDVLVEEFSLRYFLRPAETTSPLKVVIFPNDLNSERVDPYITAVTDDISKYW